MTTDVGSLRSLTRISGRRRDGLRTLLTRKTPPKGTAGFVAATLADHAEIVAQVGGNHLAADLLAVRRRPTAAAPALPRWSRRPATPAPRSSRSRWSWPATSTPPTSTPGAGSTRQPAATCASWPTEGTPYRRGAPRLR